MKKVIHPQFTHLDMMLYEDSPSFSGILTGQCKGDVWVDHLSDPSIALVYSHRVGGFSIMGHPKSAETYTNFIKFLKDVLWVELKNNGINHFEFSVEEEETEVQILKRLSLCDVKSEQEYYLRQKNHDASNQNIYEHIIKVDNQVIKDMNQNNYKDSSFLTHRILESWESYEHFNQYSLGFIYVIDQEIVGVIIGSARYNDVIAIDIETKNEHRNKDIATSLTQCFLNACKEKGFIAQWNCVESNIASERVATKSGFELFKKKKYYWIKI